MKSIPILPIYLFYGTQTHQILDARDRVIAMLVEKEQRGEYVTEYFPEGNRKVVELVKTLPEIDAELASISLIPDARKVAVVNNPAELYAVDRAAAARKAAKKSKSGKQVKPERTPADRIASWIENVLPATGNHLILLVYEDESEGRELNDKSPLVSLIARIGYTQMFRDRVKAFFKIEDALIARNPNECLKAIDDLWGPGKGAMSVYSAVVRCIRFMLQSNIGREKRVAGDPGRMRLYFPDSPSLSIFKAADFVQRKYRATPYRSVDLIEAYQRLTQVYRALRPASTDLHVPDARAILEQILIQLFTSPRPSRG